MKAAALIIFGVIFLTASTAAQVSPVPVVDSEVRDSQSIRMRSLEIERAERSANKAPGAEIQQEAKIKFARISENFEAIQKLQSSIVEAYTKGRAINYGKISDSATEMRTRAVRFGVDFFSADPEMDGESEGRSNPPESDDVRTLVIELEKAIGAFVASPVFGKAVVDSRSVESAQSELFKIIQLSERLSRAADKLR